MIVGRKYSKQLGLDIIKPGPVALMKELPVAANVDDLSQNGAVVDVCSLWSQWQNLSKTGRPELGHIGEKNAEVLLIDGW